LRRFSTRFTENSSQLILEPRKSSLAGSRVMQNQGLIVLCACAVGVDLLNAAARECGKLFDDCAVDKDAEPPSTHGAMLQRPAINHDLTRLIRRRLDCGGKWHPVASPGHVEVGHILDSEPDSYQDIWTLQSHPVDSVTYGLAEEVRLARRRWRPSATQCQCVRQRQRSAKPAAVAVTTLAGHVSTVAGHGRASHDRTRARSSVGQVRSRRCSRSGCQRPATSTLTYAYRDSTAVLGPLASQAEPHCYDLCQQHAQTLSAPRGWEMIRLTVEEQPKPTSDDLLALADAVRDVGLSYDPPAGPIREPQMQRSGLIELARRGHLTVLADPGAG
jgi:Protein of unknown function (DUF3499)